MGCGASKPKETKAQSTSTEPVKNDSKPTENAAGIFF